MDTSKVIGMIVGGVVQACVTFVIVVFLIKGLWGITVRDFLPGAVDWELVAREISWAAAAKLAVFVAVLSALFGGQYTMGSGRKE